MFELQSPEINEIMDAIAAMHDKYGLVIEKNKKGHKGTYVDLPGALSDIHARCKEFGITLIQPTLASDNNVEWLETMIYHRPSKQWIKSLTLPHINPSVLSPDQVWGGSNTYHRRYAAMGILGLCSADDPADHDGWKDHDKSAASPATTEQEHPIRAAMSDAISDKQCNLLRVKLKNNKELEKTVLEGVGVATIAEIPWSRFNKILKFVEEQNQ